MSCLLCPWLFQFPSAVVGETFLLAFDFDMIAVFRFFFWTYLLNTCAVGAQHIHVYRDHFSVLLVESLREPTRRVFGRRDVNSVEHISIRTAQASCKFSSNQSRLNRVCCSSRFSNMCCSNPLTWCSVVCVVLLFVLPAFCDVHSESSINSARFRAAEPPANPTDSGE